MCNTLFIGDTDLLRIEFFSESNMPRFIDMTISTARGQEISLNCDKDIDSSLLAPYDPEYLDVTMLDKYKKIINQFTSNDFRKIANGLYDINIVWPNLKSVYLECNYKHPLEAINHLERYELELTYAIT